MSLTILLTLGQGNIQRLGDNVSAIHLGDSLGCFLRGRKADEAEALASALLAGHNLGACDSAERSKFLAEHLVINRIVKILHVQVNSLVPVQTFKLHHFKLLLELLLSLSLLLGATNIQVLTTEVHTIQILDGLLGRFSIFVADKAESLQFASFLSHNLERRNLSKHLVQLVLTHFISKVLHIHICELLGLLSKLLLPLLSGDETADKDLLVKEQHTVGLLDSVLGSLLSLKVNKSIALAVAFSILGDLTRQNISKGGECIVHLFVVDTLIQILDENITHTTSTEGGITLAPHNTHGTVLQHLEVHQIKGTFGISRLLKVDIGVSKRPTGNHVPADTNGEDRADNAEFLEEHGLGNIRSKITNIQACHRVVGSWLLTRSSPGGSSSSS